MKNVKTEKNYNSGSQQSASKKQNRKKRVDITFPETVRANKKISENLYEPELYNGQVIEFYNSVTESYDKAKIIFIHKANRWFLTQRDVYCFRSNKYISIKECFPFSDLYHMRSNGLKSILWTKIDFMNAEEYKRIAKKQKDSDESSDKNKLSDDSESLVA